VAGLLALPRRQTAKFWRNGPDRSLADYTFCKFSAQRGFTGEEIAAELPNVSEKARERIRNRDPGHVTKTA
jgi:hypothetical protein